MARKTKSAAEAAPVAVETTAPVAAEAVNPFAALAAPSAPVVPVGVAAKAAKVLAALPADAANSVGAAMAAVAPSIAAKGIAVGKYPATVADHSYVLGAKLAGGACPARGAHDVAVVAKIHATVVDGKATAADLQNAGVPWHSMAAYLKRGWLVQA